MYHIGIWLPYSEVVGSHWQRPGKNIISKRVNDSVMSEKNGKRVKWLHVRLTEKEHEKLTRKFSKTTCRKLSEFARKVLLDKPVTANQRNQSLDDFMAELIMLRNELNAIGNNYNQLVKRLHTLKEFPDIKNWLLLHESARKILTNKVDEIKLKISLIDDKWLQ